MTAEINSRKFKDDRVINLINSSYISLKDHDMKRNNRILHKIINEVVTVTKENNEFFKDHYRNIIFVGSYYKGTKVGKPEEFDLNLIIQLPVRNETIQFESNVPGYTKLQLRENSRKDGWKRHEKILEKWVTPEGYLIQEKFRHYMESTFGKIPQTVTVDNETYELDLKKSGPAFTLYVKGPESMVMSVDLVPVLEFRTQPPIARDFGGASWFVVPKTNGKREITDSHLYWRMSFYEVEKAMLRQFGCLKPVIRQVKKLRDTTGWSLISSYYIETLFLHRIKDMESKPELQKNSMTEHFMDMLGLLKEACETHKIINFWDESDNFFESVKPNQMTSIKRHLDRIIKEINKDPFAIADYVLTKEERNSIETELNGYRNSGKSAKSADQQSVKANETTLMNSKSCNMTPSNESAIFIENFLTTLHTDSAVTMEKTLSEPAANAVEKNAATSVTATKQEVPVALAFVKEEFPFQTVPRSVTTVTGGKAPSSTVVEDRHLARNDTEKDSLAEILNMLKLIHSEVADTKNAVNLLMRRVIVVEEKVNIIMSRSTSHLEEQLVPTLTSRCLLTEDLLDMSPLLH